MNTLEKAMVEILKDLRDNHGATEVKTEFEAEASRVNEVMRLKEIAERVEFGMVLKIGGAEAITDMLEAKHIGVTGLIAPMIESAYALSKYLSAIKKCFSADLRREIHFGINVETRLGHENFNEMLKLEMISLIDTITVGRVDMAGSLGMGREGMNSNEVFKLTKDIYSKAKKKKFRTTMGGGISKEAVPFIEKLSKKGLLDRYETRKVVFKIPKEFDTQNATDGILKAAKFELLWLENKKKYYGGIYREDFTRIKMLKERAKLF